MVKEFKKAIFNIISPNKNLAEKELLRLSKFPRFTEGVTNIFGAPFVFHESICFVDTYREIFINEIYKFPVSTEKNIIIDCGANMGLSVVYFSLHYPNHTILAFEPDEDLFRILEKNIKSLKLKNVQTFKKAVWDTTEILKFYTDGGMGGRVNEGYTKQDPVLIEAVPLKDYLSDKINFLKVDIEGAEYRVLVSCNDKLSTIPFIFFEYHNKVSEKQTLDELLLMFKQLGYKYYIKESATRRCPFVDNDLICESFDMAINIFCYR